MSTGIESLHLSDEVQFGRDCEVTQIPSGQRIVVPKGTVAYVGQTLGGPGESDLTGPEVSLGGLGAGCLRRARRLPRREDYGPRRIR